MKFVVVSLAAALILAPSVSAEDCHETEAKREGTDHRGDHAMGFSHEASRHSFALYGDGGLISATARSANDTETRDQIRAHMKDIATRFAAGDFSAPRFIHDQVPPGAETMKSLPGQIQYRYKELPDGAGVRITTTNAKALAAVHSFLRFQIDEHRTGDSIEIVEERSTSKLP
jgi:hypothetical protein